MTGLDQLENLPLSHLFSGPLIAAIDASVQAQTETVDLLLDAGYDDEGNIRTVDFTYSSPEPDPETGDYRRVAKTLEIPVLLFLSPPNLQISLVEEEFSARLTSVEETSASSAPDRIASPFRLGVKPAARSVDRDRRRRSTFDLDVRMVAEVTNESTGMELIERAANNQTVERPDEERPKRPREPDRYRGISTGLEKRYPPDEPDEA